MIRAIIIEDEQRSADVLKALIERYCDGVEIMKWETTVEGGIAAINTNKPDLVFLDVELPDGSGFNVLEHFPGNELNVIFVTAYEHYAFKAIKACAIDYLLKPVDIDDLVNAVNKAKAEIGTADIEKKKAALVYNFKQKPGYRQKIALASIDGIHFVQLQDIVLFKAEGNYTQVVVQKGEPIVVSKPLSHFEEILDEQQFCRTHQSYMVNLYHVSKYIKGRGGCLVMSNGMSVEVSVRLKNDVLDRFIK
jgi:two-component system LytT family response regulator